MMEYSILLPLASTDISSASRYNSAYTSDEEIPLLLSPDSVDHPNSQPASRVFSYWHLEMIVNNVFGNPS